mgnify:CR=1 FL=1
MKHYILIFILTIFGALITGCGAKENSIFENTNLIAFSSGGKGFELTSFTPNSEEYFILRMSRTNLGMSFDSNSHRLVYAHGNKLYLLDESGKEIELLTYDGDLAYPIWSPDGQNIVFTAITQEARIKVYSFIDNSVKDICTNTSCNAISEDWSSDGKYILARDVTSLSAVKLIEFDVLQQNWKTIYNFENIGNVFYPKFSPSGDYIVMQFERESKNNSALSCLAILDVMSKQLQCMLDIPDTGISPVWSPSGDEIAYINEQKIFIYNLKTRLIVEQKIPKAYYKELIWGN